MTKWEYAELSYDSIPIVFTSREALLTFLGPPGKSSAFQIVQDNSQGDASFEDALTRTIVRLGTEGWELAAALAQLVDGIYPSACQCSSSALFHQKTKTTNANEPCTYLLKRSAPTLPLWAAIGCPEVQYRARSFRLALPQTPFYPLP